MPAVKHAVESYKHYTLYAVAGITPTMFIAEMADPSKGVTVTADSLEQLKAEVDKKLNCAAKIKINVWQGPVNNCVFQKNIVARITRNGINYTGFAIIVPNNIFRPDYITESDDDKERERKEREIDCFIEMIYCRPLRMSKKYRKMNKHMNLSKFFKHNATVHQG